jgi:hypothetical protein
LVAAVGSVSRRDLDIKELVESSVCLLEQEEDDQHLKREMN